MRTPALLLLFSAMNSGCLHIADTDSVPRTTYDTVAKSFLMLAREDVKDGKSVWSQGSAVAVAGDDGRHFIYTSRHVLFDKDNGGALPTRLYATRMTGESIEIDISNIEVPKLNHDAVRVAIPTPICPELHLADHLPRYGERLFFFGDANGAGVMCAEVGKVIAVGPLEFEHTADIMRGMSGGPIVDSECRLDGLCQKGRKTTVRQDGVELPSDSRYLKTRRFGAILHNISWRPFAERMAERLSGIDGVEIEITHTAKQYWKTSHAKENRGIIFQEELR